MKVITGKAKVKDDSTFIYRGHTLEVTGIYIDYKDGRGHGIYADGSREYKVSLIGTKFEEMYKGTVIHDSHLENLELFQTVILPLDEQETLDLIDFSRACALDGDLVSKEYVLEMFLERQKGPHTPPEQDPNSIYDEVEWNRRNPKLKPIVKKTEPNLDVIRDVCKYCHKQHIDYACDAQIESLKK